MVFTDPNTSMVKARQFGEQLVTALVTTFGIRIPTDKDSQYKRLKVLLDQAVINKRVHSWFDAVRDTGNKAVHEGFAHSGTPCGWSEPATTSAPGSTAR
jgi:type I restriction enzyme R subunit